MLLRSQPNEACEPCGRVQGCINLIVGIRPSGAYPAAKRTNHRAEYSLALKASANLAVLGLHFDVAQCECRLHSTVAPTWRRATQASPLVFPGCHSVLLLFFFLRELCGSVPFTSGRILSQAGWGCAIPSESHRFLESPGRKIYRGFIGDSLDI